MNFQCLTAALPSVTVKGMATSKEAQTQAVLERAHSREVGTDEWWTILSFEDGDFSLEPDPVLTRAGDAAELERRLYSI